MERSSARVESTDVASVDEILWWWLREDGSWGDVATASTGGYFFQGLVQACHHDVSIDDFSALGLFDALEQHGLLIWGQLELLFTSESFFDKHRGEVVLAAPSAGRGRGQAGGDVVRDVDLLHGWGGKSIGSVIDGAAMAYLNDKNEELVLFNMAENTVVADTVAPFTG